MSLTILNVGHKDDEALLREVAATDEETPSIHTLGNFEQAHVWAVAHQPDITVVDVRQFNGEGIDFMRHFRASRACNDIPLLAVLNERDRERRAEALLA